jgi:hypothetical protein
MLDRKLNGPAVIVAATVLTLVIYGLIRWLWVIPRAEMGNGEEAISWGAVGIITVLAGLVAWGVAALLKRNGKARWFPWLGGVVLAISLIGPLGRAEGSSVWALIVLHVVAGITLIYGFTRVLFPEGWQAANRSNEPSSLTG